MSVRFRFVSMSSSFHSDLGMSLSVYFTFLVLAFELVRKPSFHLH